MCNIVSLVDNLSFKYIFFCLGISFFDALKTNKPSKEIRFTKVVSSSLEDGRSRHILMDKDLKSRINASIIDEYQKLKSSSKPVIRSNGTKEWTILASMLVWNTKTDSIRLISLTTGVKALPDSLLDRSSGKMVHDCHAEILAIRGFNSVILKHISDLKSGKGSDLIDVMDGKYQWKPYLKLILYISRLPCGDASMDNVEIGDEDIHKFPVLNDDSYQFAKKDNRTILRGRLDFSKKSVVRTKPGRYDSIITYSKSCSDKLCVKQVTSLLNCLTFSLMNEPVYLDYLIVPNLSDNDIIGLKRCFKERLEGSSFPVNYFQIESCEGKFIDDKQSHNEDPSASSTIKLYCDDKSDVIEQVILNGVKNGFYTKGSKPLRKNCESIVSRYAQWSSYKELSIDTQVSYLTFKDRQQVRRSLISSVRHHLSPDGWIKTARDDCI